MMSGEATPSQMGGLLMALRVRGETVDEITGAASTMRAKMTKVAAPPDAIDVVGTGGDASGSYNVSTCAALIVAGAGVPVAKHGNRALSSKSGAADVLGALGVKIDLRPDEITRCIYEAGIGFMFAPSHHPATKNVAPTRVELGTRTIFNLLGPISNPAGVKRQMIGVFSRQWVEPMAQVAKLLGSECVWVAHGSDGLDEITTSGPSYVAALENGNVRTFEINPEDVGIAARQAGGTARRRRRDERSSADGRAQGHQGSVPRHRDPQCRRGADRRRQGQGFEGRRSDRGKIARQRRGRRPARPADRSLERAMNDILKKIEAYKREEIAAAKRARPYAAVEAAAKAAVRAARVFEGDRAARRFRRIRADRRDQEGEPVGGSHSRRFRSAVAGARL